MDILPYGIGIATGTVGPCDMSAFQIFNVKVIISDSSGSDKRNFTPFQEGFVATSAGSDNQGIGIMYVVGADGYSGFVITSVEIWAIASRINGILSSTTIFMMQS